MKEISFVYTLIMTSWKLPKENISLKLVGLAPSDICTRCLVNVHPTGRKLTVLKRAGWRRGESPKTCYPCWQVCGQPVSIRIQAETAPGISCHWYLKLMGPICCFLLACSFGWAPPTIRVFETLQSGSRDLSPLRHLIRVMRKHDLTNFSQKMSCKKKEIFIEHFQNIYWKLCMLLLKKSYTFVGNIILLVNIDFW